jgi:hypothetical protein
MSDGMTDTLTGADDGALFDDVISGAIEADPQPSPQPEPTPAPAPAPAAAVDPQQQPQPQQTEPAIPPGRLREETEARRAAERRSAELEARLAALERQQQPQPQPRQRADVFEDPSAFVKEEVQPILDPVTQQITQMREFYSRREAERAHGQEKVVAAYRWIEQGLASRDPDAVAVYQRAMQSMDPYGDIVMAHQQRQTFNEIGGDLNAYRQRVLEEAMKDPAFQAKVIEATRAQAQQTGQTIAKPAVTSLPSISRVGATAINDGQEPDLSDNDLFEATTRRKRG